MCPDINPKYFLFPVHNKKNKNSLNGVAIVTKKELNSFARAWVGRYIYNSCETLLCTGSPLECCCVLWSLCDRRGFQPAGLAQYITRWRSHNFYLPNSHRRSFIKPEHTHTIGFSQLFAIVLSHTQNMLVHLVFLWQMAMWQIGIVWDMYCGFYDIYAFTLLSIAAWK